MQITAIIQARMGSSRLPGKVLLPAGGRPLLEWLANQLAHCRRLDSIVLATTTAPADDAIAQTGQRLGWRVARGPEDDVLERYCLAAQEAGLTAQTGHVMRLTADCPLVQPDVCDALAELYASGCCDYARTSERFAEGLDCELVSLEALLCARAEARLASEREHVTLFVRNRPERFRLCELQSPEDNSRYRLTVDEPEDYEVVRALLEALGRPGRALGFAEVAAHLEAHPELLRRNAHILRNEGLLKSLASEALEKDSE